MLDLCRVIRSCLISKSLQMNLIQLIIRTRQKRLFRLHLPTNFLREVHAPTSASVLHRKHVDYQAKSKQRKQEKSLKAMSINDIESITSLACLACHTIFWHTTMSKAASTARPTTSIQENGYRKMWTFTR